MIYVCCFAVSIFFAHLAQQSKNKGVMILCSLISILVPSILGGLRATGIGTDTAGYGYDHYRLAANSQAFLSFLNLFGKVSQYRELGYKALCYFAAKNLGHVNWCYFLYQLITVSCVYIGAYRHRKITSMAMIMFIFLFMFYNYSYNAMRQSMAAAIIFMGINYMETKKYGKFLFYIIAATFFHLSAVVAIPFLMIVHIGIASDFFKKNIVLRIIFIYGSLIFLVFARVLMMRVISFIPILNKYSHYFFSKYNDSGIVWGLVLLFTGELILLLLYNRGALKAFNKGGFNKDNVSYYKFQAVFLIIYLVAVRFFTRVLDYSSYANMIILAALPNFVKNKHLKVLITLAVISALFLWWLWRYIYHGHSDTWPYKSIL